MLAPLCRGPPPAQLLVLTSSRHSNDHSGVMSILHDPGHSIDNNYPNYTSICLLLSPLARLNSSYSLRSFSRVSAISSSAILSSASLLYAMPSLTVSLHLQPVASPSALPLSRIVCPLSVVGSCHELFEPFFLSPQPYSP
jgi:hypothetical protein